MRKFEKNTARKSLPSASQLPIIVPMKIWFRTEAEQGGQQSPQQHRSTNPTSLKSPWSPQRPVASSTPAENRAEDFLGRGAARWARFSLSEQRHPLAATRSPRSPRRPVSFALPAANTADHFLRITVIPNRELLVLEILQLFENTRRQPVLIENFEPNSAPSFRPFAAAAFRPIAFPILEDSPEHFGGHGAN
jgi:hypothetical protein